METKTSNEPSVWLHERREFTFSALHGREGLLPKNAMINGRQIEPCQAIITWSKAHHRPSEWELICVKVTSMPSSASSYFEPIVVVDRFDIRVKMSIPDWLKQLIDQTKPNED